MIELIILLVTAYLLGSIPTAVWIGKFRYGIDVREHGSKNAGATNTFRVLGNTPGLVVLLLDISKGILAVSIPELVLGADDALLEKVKIMCAVIAVLGHLYPVFAQFKGGKGVATSLGVIIGLEPLAALYALLVFLLVFLISRFVSLGALVTAALFPFILKYAVGSDSLWLLSFSILVSSIVILAHRQNITRLLNGDEKKMNFSRK
jgi:glycerol-3-phosphate acyltransferase PlsY